MSGLLRPPLKQNAPIKLLELLWLDCVCAYDQLDETLMEDTDWDKLTVELQERVSELSPYFTHAVPLVCVLSSTSSGIDWKRGIPALVLEGLTRAAGRRRRLWQKRLSLFTISRSVTVSP